MQKCLNVQIVVIILDLLQMDENKLEELLTLTRDNNKMLKDIWTILNNPNNDIKDLVEINIKKDLILNIVKQSKELNPIVKEMTFDLFKVIGKTSVIIFPFIPYSLNITYKPEISVFSRYNAKCII